MSSECKGCISSNAIFPGRGPECLYTISGVKDLLNCPCKECLVKVICKEKCYIFRVNKYDKVNKGRGTPNIKSRIK